MKTKVPSIDPVLERIRLMACLENARKSDDVMSWKLEAKALLDLGQLEKWIGNKEKSEEFMLQSSKVCRYHTLTKMIHE